jgi:hypothetical protein
MIAEAMMPRPGAASGVVPKNGIGTAFWIAGVPGNADTVNVVVPKAIAAGINRLGIPVAVTKSLIGARPSRSKSMHSARICRSGLKPPGFTS